jgi:hypothetical protein
VNKVAIPDVSHVGLCLEGTDARAEGEAVTGVEWWPRTLLSGLARHRQQQLPVSFIGMTQCLAHLH